MTRHDPIQSMRDMLDHAEKAVRFVEGKCRQDLVRLSHLRRLPVGVEEGMGDFSCPPAGEGGC